MSNKGQMKTAWNDFNKAAINCGIALNELASTLKKVKSKRTNHKVPYLYHG